MLLSRVSKNSFMISGNKNIPFASENFIAFHSAGLCEAVIHIPPCAFNSFTLKSSVGVATIPSQMTSTPTLNKPAIAAWARASPVVRESLPATILILFSL
jgi:hypothetical protein